MKRLDGPVTSRAQGTAFNILVYMFLKLLFLVPESLGFEPMIESPSVRMSLPLPNAIGDLPYPIFVMHPLPPSPWHYKPGSSIHSVEYPSHTLSGRSTTRGVPARSRPDHQDRA